MTQSAARSRAGAWWIIALVVLGLVTVVTAAFVVFAVLLAVRSATGGADVDPHGYSMIFGAMFALVGFFVLALEVIGLALLVVAVRRHGRGGSVVSPDRPPGPPAGLR